MYNKANKTYRKYRTKILLNARIDRIRIRAKIIAILSDICYVCGSKCKTPQFHEIHGKPHSSNGYRYVLSHIEDFVTMCANCHLTLHKIHNFDKEKRKRFKSLLTLLDKGIT